MGKKTAAASLLLILAGVLNAPLALAQFRSESTRAKPASTARPLCRHGYRLRGNGQRGYMCSRHGHRSLKPRCQRDHRLRARRHGFICVATARPPAPAAPTPMGAAPPAPPVAPQPPATPLTAANVCGFNPGLGQVESAPSLPTLVYWDTNRDGQPDFGAVNLEGDNKADVAFVLNARQELLWLAFCPPRETAWINVPRYVQQQQTSIDTNYLFTQAFGSPGAMSTVYNAVTDPVNYGAVWVDSDPSVGSVGPGNCNALAINCLTLAGV
jgi:hypothetical protein